MLKIRFHPYKIHIAQQLINKDKEVWVEFCTAMLGLLLNNLFMTGEAHFHLCCP